MTESDFVFLQGIANHGWEFTVQEFKWLEEDRRTADILVNGFWRRPSTPIYRLGC